MRVPALIRIDRTLWLTALALAVMLITGLATGCGSSGPLHQNLDAAKVTKVELWGTRVTRDATALETAAIVAWFNAGFDPRENTAHVGSTPEAGIIIRLTSGETVLVNRDGTDVEVSAHGKQYWLRQPDLRRFLDNLVKPPAVTPAPPSPQPAAGPS